MVFLHCNINDVESTLNIWKFIQDIGPTVVSIIAVLATLWVTNETLKSQAAQNLKTLNAQKDIEINSKKVKRVLWASYSTKN